MSSRESSTAAAVLAEAVRWIGTPYRHQASRRGIGCDCLGLVRGIWRTLYGAEPEQPGAYAPDWAETGEGDPLADAARRHFAEMAAEDASPGDLVLFRWRPDLPARHAGILTGAERFIHAYQGHAVMESALVPHWRRRIAGVFAFPPVPDDTTERF